jgi:hypothetical protein
VARVKVSSLVAMLALVLPGCGGKRRAVSVALDGPPADVFSGDGGAPAIADAPVASDLAVELAAGSDVSGSDLAGERAAAADGPAFEVPPPAFCGGQGDPQDCQAASGLKLEDPALPFAPDGTVARGENIVFEVVLANRGTKNFSTYPCVAFVSDHPLVKFQNGPPTCECLFAIFAGMTHTITGRARVDPAIPAGTVIHVAANVAPLHGKCVGLSQVALPVTVR